MRYHFSIYHRVMVSFELHQNFVESCLHLTQGGLHFFTLISRIHQRTVGQISLSMDLDLVISMEGTGGN